MRFIGEDRLLKTVQRKNTSAANSIAPCESIVLNFSLFIELPIELFIDFNVGKFSTGSLVSNSKTSG